MPWKTVAMCGLACFGAFMVASVSGVVAPPRSLCMLRVANVEDNITEREI
jgi:hypothetical protein